jgi:hypothetical protein
MTALRKRISHLAALVLLGWLFVFGSALAQACDSHAHAVSDDCCTTMQASALRPSASADVALPAQASLSWFLPAARVHLAVPPLPGVALAPCGRLWDDSGQSIPIVFLRLAL